MKSKYLKGLAVATLLSATPVFAADYVIDTAKAHAFIEFKISHLGTSWLKGRFNKFEGTFSYDADNPAASMVNVEVDVNSIDSNNAERDKHLRAEKYLDTDKFGTASFKSTSFTPNAEGGVMKGMLTLYGTTKEIAIDVQMVGEGQDPWGGYRAGFSGTTEIKPKDYGMTFNLGPAAETVYLELNIEGIRK
ncbi:MAG: YceI family protein [Neptuniibacter sp.]